MNDDIQSAECPFDIMERLAEIEHDRWSGQAVTALNEMTPERRERWGRLSKIKYADLDEHNKELDRMQVREYWPVIGKYIESRDAAQRQAGREEREGELAAMHDAWCDDTKERYAALVEAVRKWLPIWADLCACPECKADIEVFRKALRDLDEARPKPQAKEDAE